MSLKARQCSVCKHVIDGSEREINGKFVMSCSAFPDVIPIELFNNRIPHDKPYPWDNGIQFEQAENMPIV